MVFKSAWLVKVVFTFKEGLIEKEGVVRGVV